ncbi:MAG: hypothetical protein HC865_18680 [Cyanobacteria bacterium RU_5_0]|nr:hypothetical protein [Cyanobacteria bacterium RU_5_0]
MHSSIALLFLKFTLSYQLRDLNSFDRPTPIPPSTPKTDRPLSLHQNLDRFLPFLNRWN